MSIQFSRRRASRYDPRCFARRETSRTSITFVRSPLQLPHQPSAWLVPFLKEPPRCACPKSSPRPSGSRGATDVEFPLDWPGAGPIDLDVHDLPHASSALEWWYVNTHFETADGRDLALFAAFFRELKGRHAVTGEPEYAHSIAWALSDAARQRFYPCCAGRLGRARVRAAQTRCRRRAWRTSGSTAPCAKCSRAAGFRAPRGCSKKTWWCIAIVSSSTTRAIRFVKRADGTYELRLYDASTRTGCDLTFKPKKPPMRHGDDGVCHGVADELMFYYFIPRCELKGSVVVEGEEQTLRRGTGWYDHEFGFIPKKKASPTSRPSRRRGLTAWNWAALQLEDGIDVTIYSITRIATGEVARQLGHHQRRAGAKATVRSTSRSNPSARGAARGRSSSTRRAGRSRSPRRSSTFASTPRSPTKRC